MMLRIGNEKRGPVEPVWQKVGCLGRLKIPHETYQQHIVLGEIEVLEPLYC